MRICLLTTGQPSTNPRLVKEADALVEAGFDVQVVYSYWTGWAVATDQQLLESRDWKRKMVGGSPAGEPWLYRWTRLRNGISRRIGSRLGGPAALYPFVLSRVTPDLMRAARSLPADLYIAHNLGALPAAVSGAKHNGALAGFDAEDFHSSMGAASERTFVDDLAETVEREYLPQCAYVTAASPAIAAAYSEKYHIALPETILNVFLLRERPSAFRRRDSRAPLKLQWFSQTIGEGRGLEDAVRAMGLIGDSRIELHLRGNWARGYRDTLRSLASSVGVAAEQIRDFPPAPPSELIRLSAGADVGLSLEDPSWVNRDLCITNKIFTYLLAGNAIAATDTRGHRDLLPSLGSACFIYRPGDAGQLADSLRFWATHPDALEEARRKSWECGSGEYNWEREKQKFLVAVERILSRTAPNKVFA